MNESAKVVVCLCPLMIYWGLMVTDVRALNIEGIAVFLFLCGKPTMQLICILS